MTPDIKIQLVTAYINGTVQLAYIALTAYGLRLVSQYLMARLQRFGAEPITIEKQTTTPVDPTV